MRKEQSFGSSRPLLVDNSSSLPELLLKTQRCYQLAVSSTISMFSIFRTRETTVHTLRLIGIDFSGSAEQWSAGKRSSNVWIAVASSADGGELIVESLRTVQELPGSDHPFDRLIRFLASENFDAAGIDAPFSVPSAYVPQTHSSLLELVAALGCDGRPFARGHRLIETVMPQFAPKGKKLWRRTESEWRAKGVNVRSTFWNGPRGGAPFPVACLTLLHRCGRRIWPWYRGEKSCFVEAFPAAQLQHWKLPFIGYNGDSIEAAAKRKTIIQTLKHRGLYCSTGVDVQMINCADALDAVICVYAAKGTVECSLATDPWPISESEGWIAVHR